MMNAGVQMLQGSSVALGPIMVTMLILWLAAYPVYRWKIRRLQTFLNFWLGSLALNAWWIWRLTRLPLSPGQFYPAGWLTSGLGQSRDTAILSSAIFFLLAGFSIPYLYQKWSGQTLTDKERARGMQGVAAWLSPLRIVIALFLAFFGNAAGVLSITTALMLAAGSLLAYPFWMSFVREECAKGENEVDLLTAERERVLRMLENGRITAEESAELLHALGPASPAPRSVSFRSMNRSQRLILVGALLVVVSFFFPWFRIHFEPGTSLGAALKMMGIANHSMKFTDPGMVANAFSPNGSLQNISMDIFGADLNRGMGEMVLILAIFAALFPYISASLPPFLGRVALLIGSCVLLILLFQNFRFASVGFLMAILGYALSWIGTLKEQGFSPLGNGRTATE